MEQSDKFGVRLTLVVTNLIKLGGLGLAYKAAFVAAHPQALSLALAGFMIAGGQFSEETVIGLVTRFFGQAPPPPPKSIEPSPPMSETKP